LDTGSTGSQIKAVINLDNLLLKVDNLKTYFFTRRGIVKAVDGVSFSLNEGQTLGLVGESGCGKTVTGLSILRLEPKPAGKIVGGNILFQGENLVKMSEPQMRAIRGGKISIIMQDPNTSLNPAYTIGNQIMEMLRLHLKLKGKFGLEKMVQSLKSVRIPAPESRANNFPHQLSGGMKQRVSGAMAISCRPSLIIADEPTTALDVTTQAQYLDLLSDLQKETGVALIFITHDLGIVASMCDRVCVMYAGKIVESGTVEEVWNNPRHPYTKALINSIPKLEQKVNRLYSIEGKVPSLLNLPQGCTFYPRCEQVNERCKQEYPLSVDLGNGHTVSCWQAAKDQK
jgi:oligopeptide transport system ATP-binding protein